ncbi:hypothetical protein QYZ88_009255 [Lachnospiraceae bacterium C1.1]|nr:hypothetical protein [Lachnospiraceae bacterium C1.1]
MSEEKKENPMESSTPYDDAFRTMETKCDDLLIPFVNHIFGEKYDKRAIIKRLRNEEFIEHKNGSMEKKITDSSFEIIFDEMIKKYHIECESSRYDGSILIRIFEYDSQIARTDVEGDLYKVIFDFPNTGLLLLRKTERTPENALIELKMPDGNAASYKVPFLRIWDYSIDEIFEHRLYMLIPFYIFKYENELDTIDGNTQELSNLLEEYKKIRARLDKENENGNLSAISLSVIIKLTHRVAYNLTMKRKNIQKKVGDLMGGHVIDLPEFKIYDNGKADGIAEGKAEGIRIFIEDKLEDGIPEETIVEKLKKRYDLPKEKAKEYIERYRSAVEVNK